MRIVLLLLFMCYGVGAIKAHEPILLRIDNEEVSRLEFERAYNKRYPDALYDKKLISSYLKLFVDERLKIAEAKSLRLDTLCTLTSQMSAYRKKQIRNHLLSLSLTEKQLKKNPIELRDDGGKTRLLQVVQIVKYLPQNTSLAEQEKAKAFMNSLYAELTANPEADFSAYVQKYSDDKHSFEVAPLQTTPEFEEIVFSLQRSVVSPPFITPLGVHIVKVLDDKYLPYEVAKERLFSLQELKKEYRYTPNQISIDELLANEVTDGVLFTLNGEGYTGTDFSFFSEGNPKKTQRQFDDFVLKSVLDYAYLHLEQRDLEFASLMQAYQDQLLLTEITRREIGEKAYTDQAGLMAYFSVYKKKYRFVPARFKGAVLHGRSKRVLSEAKKRIKKVPQEEWQARIEERFNSGDIRQVEMVQGLFAEGDDVFVDKLVFKKGTPEPISSYLFTAVVGKKIKTPERYEDVLDSLTADYEDFLETRWLSRLHTTFRVEINEEVLKTVNNH